MKPTPYTKIRIEFVLRTDKSHVGLPPELSKITGPGGTLEFICAGLKAVGVTEGYLMPGATRQVGLHWPREKKAKP